MVNNPVSNIMPQLDNGDQEETKPACDFSSFFQEH